mmetsp:Transcript_8446/g.24216  ORF Transcript_8446/g.24216 Transcript_8446/m.24216 type:complete len:239 (-) Transcript_8446:431-1147(-)
MTMTAARCVSCTTITALETRLKIDTRWYRTCMACVRYRVNWEDNRAAGVVSRKWQCSWDGGEVYVSVISSWKQNTDPTYARESHKVSEKVLNEACMSEALPFDVQQCLHGRMRYSVNCFRSDQLVISCHPVLGNRAIRPRYLPCRVIQEPQIAKSELAVILAVPGSNLQRQGIQDRATHSRMGTVRGHQHDRRIRWPLFQQELDEALVFAILNVPPKGTIIPRISKLFVWNERISSIV